MGKEKMNYNNNNKIHNRKIENNEATPTKAFCGLQYFVSNKVKTMKH